MREFDSERVLCDIDGCSIVAQKFWVTPWDTVEEVVLRPKPTARARDLRPAISTLLYWRDRFLDQQGPNPDTDGPAMTKLISEWMEHPGWRRVRRQGEKRGWRPSWVEIAKAMNAHVERVFERDAVEAERWLNDLKITGSDRTHTGEWLTPQVARNAFNRFRYRWRNAPRP